MANHLDHPEQQELQEQREPDTPELAAGKLVADSLEQTADSHPEAADMSAGLRQKLLPADYRYDDPTTSFHRP